MMHKVITNESRHKGWSGRQLQKAVIDEAIVDNLAMSIEFRGGSSRMPLSPENLPHAYRRPKQLLAYQLSEAFHHGFTEDEFVKDYTGPKKLYQSFLSGRFVTTAMHDLNQAAILLQKQGATIHSQAFELAAGRVFDSELARNQRYEAGRKAAGQVIQI